MKNPHGNLGWDPSLTNHPEVIELNSLLARIDAKDKRVGENIRTFLNAQACFIEWCDDIMRFDGARALDEASTEQDATMTKLLRKMLERMEQDRRPKK